MKSPRLLPIVIFAALALLLFKGIGIVSNGGYVLSGPVAARAAEGATDSGEPGPSVENAAPRTEPTMSDSSPTISDPAPTLATKPADAASSHGEGTQVAATAPPPAAGAAPTNGTAAAASTAPTAPGVGPPATDTACPPPATAGPPPATADISAASLSTNGCAPADAVAMRVDVNGIKTPLTGAEGASLTEATLLQRLAERRAQLDKRETALAMRESIVAAAEKQMQDRADALKALEAQIASLSDEKKSMADDQFAGVVKMYEAMKPQEAAPIFDGLDMEVLMRVAKAMDPRKMSPILAKMSAQRAQELTTLLAAADPQTAAPAAPAAADPNALPQIVGH